MSEVEEAAAAANQDLDRLLDMLQTDIDSSGVSSAAEVLLKTRQQFVNYSYYHLACGIGSHIVTNYAALAASLVRLLECRRQIAHLTDQLEMHKSVIRSLGELEDL